MAKGVEYFCMVIGNIISGEDQLFFLLLHLLIY